MRSSGGGDAKRHCSDRVKRRLLLPRCDSLQQSSAIVPTGASAKRAEELEAVATAVPKTAGRRVLARKVRYPHSARHDRHAYRGPGAQGAISALGAPRPTRVPWSWRARCDIRTRRATIDTRTVVLARAVWISRSARPRPTVAWRLLLARACSTDLLTARRSRPRPLLVRRKARLDAQRKEVTGDASRVGQRWDGLPALAADATDGSDPGTACQRRPEHGALRW